MNETTWVAGAEKTLEANGAATADGVYTQADDANLTVADVAGFTHLSFESIFTYGTPPTIGSVVDIYAQALNFEGTNDNEPPQADFMNEYVCSIPLNDVATAQYFKTRPVLNPYPLTEVAFYIANRGGQSLSLGWTLKVTPMTFAPG